MSSKEPPLEHPRPEDAEAAMQTWRLLFLHCQENLETLEDAARSRLDPARAGLALGADACLVQPRFDPSELFDRIQSLRPPVPTLQQSTDTSGSE